MPLVPSVGLLGNSQRRPRSDGIRLGPTTLDFCFIRLFSFNNLHDASENWILDYCNKQNRSNYFVSASASVSINFYLAVAVYLRSLLVTMTTLSCQTLASASYILSFFPLRSVYNHGL